MLWKQSLKNLHGRIKMASFSGRAKSNRYRRWRFPILRLSDRRDIIQALRYIVEQIYTVVAATTDGNGEPVTCAIDIMDYDTDGLYFLTAKGKNFYNRLKKRGSQKEGIT